MKLFRTDDYIHMENPFPGRPFRPEILFPGHKAKDLGGMFGLLAPGNQVPYHYHQKRESLIIVIDGEAMETVEGETFLIKAGDVLFIPAGEKHMTVNRSEKDFRYLEFFTQPPLTVDFVEVP